PVRVRGGRQDALRPRPLARVQLRWYFFDVEVEGGVGTAWGGGVDAPAAALTATVGVDHAVMRLVVAVDLPVEQVGVELGRGGVFLHADLEPYDGVAHVLLLSLVSLGPGTGRRGGRCHCGRALSSTPLPSSPRRVLYLGHRLEARLARGLPQRAKADRSVQKRVR